jgi:hypothetical protein
MLFDQTIIIFSSAHNAECKQINTTYKFIIIVVKKLSYFIVIKKNCEGIVLLCII